MLAGFGISADYLSLHEQWVTDAEADDGFVLKTMQVSATKVGKTDIYILNASQVFLVVFGGLRSSPQDGGGDDALVAEVKTALQALATWHKMPQVVVRYATEPGLAERLSD